MNRNCVPIAKSGTADTIETKPNGKRDEKRMVISSNEKSVFISDRSWTGRALICMSVSGPGGSLYWQCIYKLTGATLV